MTDWRKRMTEDMQLKGTCPVRSTGAIDFIQNQLNALDIQFFKILYLTG